MSRVHVFGIGSPSGDDQAGWLAVDALLASGVRSGNEGVVKKLDRPGANLIPLLANTDWVILIDAMQSHGQIGRIRHFDHKDWSDYCHGLSSHGFGVLEALSLARELGSLPPRLDLYGIEIGSANPGEPAGSEIQSAAQQLSDLISARLDTVMPRA